MSTGWLAFNYWDRVIWIGERARWSHKTTHNEGVTLAGEDLDGVNFERLAVNTINFDDDHIMTVNRKLVIRFTRGRNETEAVA